MHVTLGEMGLGEHVDAAIAAYRADYTARGWAMNKPFPGIADLLADLRAAHESLAARNALNLRPFSGKVVTLDGKKMWVSCMAATPDGERYWCHTTSRESSWTDPARTDEAWARSRTAEGYEFWYHTLFRMRLAERKFKPTFPSASVVWRNRFWTCLGAVQWSAWECMYCE